MAERLQKILSQWGIASRRQAEDMILAGRVRLNGEVAQLGQRADPEGDRIEVDGQLVQVSDRPAHQYLLLHKPLGVVSTCDDPQGRPTVLDLLPPIYQQEGGLHPVGRLDAYSTGALLLTNDGNFTFALTHPSHEIPKTYRVWLRGDPPEHILEQWRNGVLLNETMTLPAEVRRLQKNGDAVELQVVLREGRNRQIRRVAEQLGHPVVQLHRVAIGSVQLGDLAVGEVRSLQPTEVFLLCQQANRSDPPEAF